MCSLPEYQRIPTEEVEAPPAWTKTSEINNEATYPPRPVAGTSGHGGANVTYTFEPQWPIKGIVEDAIGAMGRDKEDTIAIVQRAFPILDEYPSDRIEFSTPVDSQPIRWSRVLDDAWAGFAVNPPARLRVQVLDGPGDAAARKRRERRNVIAILIPAIGFPLLFIIFIGYQIATV